MAMLANGPIVISDAKGAYPPEGPKHSKKARMTEACQIHVYAAKELKDLM